MDSKLRPKKEFFLAFWQDALQERPRAPQERPRAPQERPKRRPRAPQNHHKSAQESTKTRLRPPRDAQDAPKCCQDASKAHQNAQDGPKTPQEVPKRMQKANLWNVFTTQVSRTNAANTYRLGGAFLGRGRGGETLTLTHRTPRGRWIPHPTQNYSHLRLSKVLE